MLLRDAVYTEESKHEFEQRFSFSSGRYPDFRRVCNPWRSAFRPLPWRCCCGFDCCALSRMAVGTALKLIVLLGFQSAHGTILDGDHVSASAWNTGLSFRYGFVLMRATENRSKLRNRTIEFLAFRPRVSPHSG